MKNVFEKLEVLYAFENDKKIISEFKRNDIAAGSCPDKIYFWMEYIKSCKSLERLEFISMNSSGRFEERVFTQGHLEFSSEKASFSNHGNIENFKILSEYDETFKQSVLKYFENLK